MKSRGVCDGYGRDEWGENVARQETIYIRTQNIISILATKDEALNRNGRAGKPGNRIKKVERAQVTQIKNARSSFFTFLIESVILDTILEIMVA